MSNHDEEHEGSAEEAAWAWTDPAWTDPPEDDDDDETEGSPSAAAGAWSDRREDTVPFPPTSSGSASWPPGSPVTPVGGVRLGPGDTAAFPPYSGPASSFPPYSGPASSFPPYSGPASSFPSAPPPAPPRRRHRLLVGGAALLVALAAAGGVGIGHLIWPSGSSLSSASTSPISSPSGSGSSGSAGSGGSNFGQSPFGSGGPGGSFFGQTPPASGGSSSGGGTEGSGGPSDVASIAAKVDPALVEINSTFSYQQAEGAGTGIVLTSTGEILTNNHVVDGATKISVTDVGNGKTYSASVVGYDSTHDIAVIQLQGASGLATAKFANSSNLAVGESVVAIGNAGGTGGTPTSAGGSITALNQSVTASDDLDGTSEQLTGMIEVNADVQAGDSGGSLVNNAGEVIGMDTAGSAASFAISSNVQGFAIPIDQAISTAAAIESGQGSSDVHVGPTAFLGVLISSSGSEGGFGGDFGGSSTSGADLSGVVSGGPAAQAGLVAGDVITSFDGQTVDSPSTLSHLMVTLHPGDSVVLGWVDASGQSHSATVVLASGPPA
jgi:S1-C subfamily serine protease